MAPADVAGSANPLPRISFPTVLSVIYLQRRTIIQGGSRSEAAEKTQESYFGHEGRYGNRKIEGYGVGYAWRQSHPLVARPHGRGNRIGCREGRHVLRARRHVYPCARLDCRDVGFVRLDGSSRRIRRPVAVLLRARVRMTGRRHPFPITDSEKKTGRPHDTMDGPHWRYVPTASISPHRCRGRRRESRRAPPRWRLGFRPYIGRSFPSP